MRKKIKEIKLGEGVGEVKFGMLREQVKRILGSPTAIEREEHSEEEDATETWDYDSYGIAFSFDEEEDWKLETITISSSFYELNGIGFIGKGMEEVQNLIESMSLGEMSFEDYSSEDKPHYELLDVDASNLFFWFDKEILTEIQFGVLWEDEETPIWP